MKRGVGLGKVPGTQFPRPRPRCSSGMGSTTSDPQLCFLGTYSSCQTLSGPREIDTEYHRPILHSLSNPVLHPAGRGSSLPWRADGVLWGQGTNQPAQPVGILQHEGRSGVVLGRLLGGQRTVGRAGGIGRRDADLDDRRVRRWWQGPTLSGGGWCRRVRSGRRRGMGCLVLMPGKGGG